MKKFVAILLSLIMVVSIFSAYAVLSEAAATIWVYDVDKTTNVSAQRQKIAATRSKSYEISYSGTAADASYGDNGVRLTDGSAGTGNTYQSVFTGSGTTTVIINLGYKAIGMTDFYARFYNSSSGGYALPTAVKYYVSTDGTTYSYAGDGEAVASPSDNTGYSIGFTKVKGCAAQYVKVEIEQSGTVACSEISAYIWADVTTISASGASDSQGLTYTANLTAGTAYVTNYTDSYTKTETVQGTGITPCSATGLVNNISYTIGAGTDDQTTVKADFISASRSNRSGEVVNDKRYVVIHNTGNYAATAYASSNHRYQTTNSACTSASWHYTVGEDSDGVHRVYQALPDNEVGWHASGGHYSLGNYNGIGMEICVNGFPGNYTSAEWTSFLNGTFYKNCRVAALLTAELCVRWNLDPGDGSQGTAIRQHWDTVQTNNYQKNCPEQMRYNKASGTYTRNTGDLWVYYMGYVDKYYEALRGGGSYEVTTEIPNSVTAVEIPQYVYVEGSNTYCRVTGISGTAFTSKSNLVSVYIPNTVTWGSPTFASSSNLVDINVSPTSPYYYSQGGVLYAVADNSVVATPAKNAGTGTAKADPAVYGVANFTLGEDYQVEYSADTAAQYFTGFYDGGKTASGIKNMFVDNISVFDANGNALSDASVVGTGTILKSEDGEDMCVLIIYGDVDGDARISATDYVVLKTHLTGDQELKGANLKAGAIGNGETISSSDLLHVRNKVSD